MVQGGTLEAMTAHVEAGYLGRKAGKGFFLYKDGKSTRELNPGATAILAKYSTLGAVCGPVVRPLRFPFSDGGHGPCHSREHQSWPCLGRLVVVLQQLVIAFAPCPTPSFCRTRFGCA